MESQEKRLRDVNVDRRLEHLRVLENMSASRAEHEEVSQLSHRSVKESSSYQLALANLEQLADVLEISLFFDHNYTCVIALESDRKEEYRGKYSGSTKSQQVNVLITFDPETHRLHVYGTLLTYFPEDPAVRLALYERLLDGALLGKDMCGGGVGLSAKNELLLLHTSLDMRTSTSSGLTVLLPEFVESLKKWRITARAVAAASVHSTPRQPTPS